MNAEVDGVGVDAAAEELIGILEKKKGGMLLGLKVYSKEEIIRHIEERTEIGLRLVRNHIEEQERSLRAATISADEYEVAKERVIGLLRSGKLGNVWFCREVMYTNEKALREVDGNTDIGREMVFNNIKAQREAQEREDARFVNRLGRIARSVRGALVEFARLSF